MDISIVVPLLNEDESLPELTDWIEKVMLQNNFSFEIIFVDDGSTDNSWEVIQTLAEKKNFVRGISFRRNYGKSAALNEGFSYTEGDVVVTMDADLQDSPEEIPELFRMIREDGYDLVSGWKQKRFDPLSKTIPTKLFNGVTSKMTGIKLHDFNCGLKAYRKEVVKSIEVYGEMHRYIPVIAKWAGFKKIGEKIVSHQARKYGTTKFGLERFINGFLDLATILFVSKFGKRPMHFFGLFGTVMFFVGAIVTLYLIGDKFYFAMNNMKSRDVVDQPLFFLALTFIILGTMLFLAGFLGELISRTAGERNFYHKKDNVRLDSQVGLSRKNYDKV